ncbi:MAG: cytochrome c3 family protein [Bacillota bacterium]
MRKLLGVLAITVISALAYAAPAFAWTHGQFTVTTDACAGCHIAHAAPAPKLLKAGPTQTEFCYLCHGEGTTSAPYDVQYGKTFGWGAAYTSTAGGFEKLWVGPGAGDYQTVTSRHTVWGYLPDGLNDAGAWDGEGSRYFTIPGGTDTLTGNGLTCGTCHDPHAGGKTPDGSGYITGNPRLLRTAILGETVDNVRFKVQDIGTSSYGGSSSDIFRVTEYKDGGTAWCGACHNKFNPPSDGDGHASQYLDMWRHPMDAHVLPPPDFDGSLATGTPLETPGTSQHVACLSCHRAHGATASMTGWATAWPRDNGAVGDTSALLRMDSRGICYNCHGAGQYNCWNDTRMDCAGCHSGGGGGGAHPIDNPGDWCMDCHLDQSHATHFDTTGKGPDIPEDETGCSVCHAAYIPVLNANACDTCHSPGGAFDGVNDPDTGALANWAAGVYKMDGRTLKSGKEHWCAGCHDNGTSFSKPKIADVIVDNLDAAFTPSEAAWVHTTSQPYQFYGADCQYHSAGGDGSATATWVPDIAIPGDYRVYARWTSNSYRATSVPYTINDAAGAHTVWVNQQLNGGTWYLLGTYNFAAGTSGSVVLADNATGGTNIIADAVWFENIYYSGTYAPNVIGDNSSYGYYINGHKQSCTVCHDPAIRHIDHKYRTYEVTEGTPCEVVTSYEDGYRLADVAGKRPMVVPKASVVNPNVLDPDEFALCFKCHVSGPVLSTTPENTNFHRDTDPYNRNFHWYHLSMQQQIWDSDWDAVISDTQSTWGDSLDSMAGCTTCHNVHGSPTPTMIRHGELISSPGTTNKVPSFDFAYAREVGVRDSTITSAYPDSVGGNLRFNGYAERPNGNYVCGDCHGGYVYYYRTPKDISAPVNPEVSNTKAEPVSVLNNGTSPVLFTALATDPNADLNGVTINLLSLGGSATQTMYDNGTNGDALAGDGTYSYRFSGTGAAIGNYNLTITAEDSLGHTDTGQVTIVVHNETGAVIVDNLEATFAGAWIISTGLPAQLWGANAHYLTALGARDGSLTTTWVSDIPSSGNYDVYARWTSHSSRGTSVPYTVYYDGGFQTVSVNQQLNGGTWRLLGTYGFTAGSSYSVVLSNNVVGGTNICADAVKWVPQP